MALALLTAAEADDALLLQLREAGSLKKASLPQLRAARDFLADGEVGWAELAARHGILQSAGAWDATIKLARRIGWLRPPAAAVDEAEPATAAVLSNMQLLLQVATAGGGSSSRSETAIATVAIAAELLGDPGLNVPAACVRHGVTIGHLGSGRKSARERAERTRAALVELGLTDWEALKRQWAVKLDRPAVKALQQRHRVSVAEAARALHAAAGDEAAAGAALLSQKRSASLEAGDAPPEEESVPSSASAVFDDPKLLRIQAALRDEALRRAAAEAGVAAGSSGLHARRGAGALVGLKTIAVAVDMAKANGGPFDLHASAVRHGISDPNEPAGRNRKGLHDRVAPVAARILELGLLEPDAAAAAADAASLLPPLPPVDDPVWMDELARRVFTDTRWRPTTELFPPHDLLRAAVELCRHMVPDIGAACDRCGISLEKCGVSTASTLRQMRDRIRGLCLLEVPPEELLTPLPPDDGSHRALLASLRLRLTQRAITTAPDAANLAVAFDVYARGVPLKVAAVRRRHQLSGSRAKAIEKLVTQLAELETKQSLDAVLEADDIETVRSMAHTSGINVPSFKSAAFALVEEGASRPAAAVAEAEGASPSEVHAYASPEQLLRATNRLRADAGLEPVDEAFFSAPSAEEGDAAPARPPRERPPPISDAMLAELQRRLQKKRKHHSLAKLPAPMMIRAAVDCCRDDVRRLRWDQINIDEVLRWHFGDESRRSSSHSRITIIRALRDDICSFGKLELLDPATKRKVRDEKDGVSGVLARNLQLLLQAANANGGSASRSAIALKTIVVALESIRDADFDLLEACTTHAIGGLGKGSGTERSFGDRISGVRQQILDNKLLELPGVEATLIDRALVEELRQRQPYLSVGRAAAAVLRHGGQLDAAVEELRSEQSSDEGEEEPVQEAEGLRLHLSRCGRSAIGATGYTGVTRSASGRLYEARSQENGKPVKLGSFSRAVDAAVAYARYRLQRGKEGFESEPEADGEEPQASAKAERPVEPVALHADVDADAEAARWEEEGEAAAMLLSEDIFAESGLFADPSGPFVSFADGVEGERPAKMARSA